MASYNLEHKLHQTEIINVTSLNIGKIQIFTETRSYINIQIKRSHELLDFLI